jgi:hypothetical protein
VRVRAAELASPRRPSPSSWPWPRTGPGAGQARRRPRRMQPAGAADPQQSGFYWFGSLFVSLFVAILDASTVKGGAPCP